MSDPKRFGWISGEILQGQAMRLPRPRFTVRWILIAVALMAVVFGAERMRQRRQVYLERAAPHVTLDTPNIVRILGFR